MMYRSFLAAILCLSVSASLPAQISRDAKFEILRTVIADQASARIALPFGNDGVDLSEAGDVNKDKLEKDMKKNGQSIETGKVVTITDLAFDDNKIEVELDGGGKNKRVSSTAFRLVSVRGTRLFLSEETIRPRKPKAPKSFFGLPR